jgi:hypothetical protein
MKRIWLSLFLLAPAFAAFAQDDTNQEETATAGEEAEPFSISTATSDSRDRLVMELNWNTLLNSPDAMNVQAKSRGFNFYFYYDLELGTDNLSLAPGLGLANSNIFHESFLAVNADSNSAAYGITEVVPFPENLDYKKNKISLTYLEVPVELRIRTNPNDKGKRFKIAAGFKAGLLINSHTKYVGDDTRPGAYPANADYVKYKEARILNVQSFRYGVTGRVGYGSVNLHAFYGLSDVFEDGLGPTGSALEVGISFNPF